ncbi:putative glycolipid transfer protein [Helianthus annuus]|nr:putative glycolipid transfer protein [Helianthus annuus]KAJ0728863.1 putative glycolipid transfer protein [Helianthus annuus]KAJ0905155.1 putative glycolipid transfer protein [Helianthus annuus]
MFFAFMIDGSQVNDLADASILYGTLSIVIDCDVKTDAVKSDENLTHKLRRVRQDLDLIRELFQNFLSTELSFDDDELEDAGAGTALSLFADAFEVISVNKDASVELRLKPFCDACLLISVLFGSLEITFKFAELEYTSKVNDLADAAILYGTLSIVIDCDVKTDTVKSDESLTHKLRRVRQGPDLIRELFQNFLSTEYAFFVF